ncbi:cache domain-containing sensor histidine kinase [Paenibacillus contaminans]|nr:sensor histidine kinase [Paenibacillus contaminans]
MRMERTGKWRLQPLLLLAFVLFTGAMLLITTAIIYFGVSRVITEQTSETRLQLIAEMQKQLTARFREVEETALSISTHPKIIEAFSNKPADPYDNITIRKEVNQIVDRFWFAKASIKSIQIYSDRFDELAGMSSEHNLPLSLMSWLEDKDRLDQSDALWVKSHMEPNVQYNPKPVVTYISKIFTDKGGVGGYLAIHVAEETVFDLFKDRKRQAGTIVLLDSGGRLISQSGSSNDGGFDPTARPKWLTELLLLQDEGYKSAKIGGTSSLILFSAPNHAQWRILEMIPADELYRGVRTIRNIVLAIGLLGILLSFPAASYLSKRIIRPIPELLAGFKQIQGGNFNTQAAEQNPIVEFNQLSQSFNRMAAQLKELLAQLREEHRAKRQAEYAALQSQINPHFLYNTLDMINWMAARKGAHDVSQMASKLAKLFRISLSKGKTFIKLGDELEHGLLYAQIQQARFKDRFTYESYAEPALKELYVPKLILQPFIENAIIHGFPKQLERQGVVKVSAELRGESVLCLIIEDNGYGLPADWNGKGSEYGSPNADGTSGYGIGNVRQRIELYFGKAYTVQLTGCGTAGVRVEITLPRFDSTDELERYINRGDDRDEHLIG